jgi:chromosome partitioning protein
MTTTVAIIGQKGGSGKSTVAVGLAVAAAQAGHTVVVIDTDPQTSIMNWKDRRTADNPMVISVQASRLTKTVEAARANDADFIVIDTAGKNESAAIEAARLADVVLIPSRPQIFDMDTLPAVRTLIRAAGDPPAFILYNFIHPQGHQIAKELKGLTQSHCGLPPCPVHLTQRAVHSEAQAMGKGPQEAEPNHPAAAELQDLYLFVSKYVRKSTSGRVAK